MNTPKERFALTGHLKGFSTIVASESFNVALDYALLELQSQMSPNVVPGSVVDALTGLDANAQMHGAQRFIAILRRLHEPDKPPTTPERKSLNYAK